MPPDRGLESPDNLIDRATFSPAVSTHAMKYKLTHYFFRQIRIKSLIHARVHVKAVFVCRHLIRVNPSAADVLTLLEDRHRASKLDAIFGGANSSSTRSDHAQFHFDTNSISFLHLITRITQMRR